jgi:hypothetical protein
MKILMIKDVKQSGKIRFEKNKEYSAPGQLTESHAKTLIESGKAKEKTTNKSKKG